jgi:hypothetical protein
MISNFKLCVLLLVLVISILFLYYFFTKETFKSKKETQLDEVEEEIEQFLNSYVIDINKLLGEKGVGVSTCLKHV